MPTLLLDKEKCLRNIEKMARKARENGLDFRPHCKTHQSAEVAGWTRDFGLNALTVSSFPMARYFARAGWKDILVAFPFQPGEMENLIGISGMCDLSVLVDSPAALPFLNHIPKQVGIYVDVDAGYGRTGIRTENPELMEQIIVKIRSNPHLEFRGFYCHAGDSYRARDRTEADRIHKKALGELGDSTATSHLQPLLEHPSTLVRGEAARALARLGETDVLERLEKDPHPFVRTVLRQASKSTAE